MEKEEEEEEMGRGVREIDGVEVCCLAVQMHCDHPYFSTLYLFPPSSLICSPVIAYACCECVCVCVW